MAPPRIAITVIVGAFLAEVGSAYGAVWPFDSAITDFNRITGTFGEFRPGHFHEGADAVPSPCDGAPVLSAVGGQGVFVTFFGQAVGAGYSVELTGAFGHYRYLHLRQHTVDPALWGTPLEAPAAGSQIGMASNTGTNQCHLHFETVGVNPLTLFPVPDSNGDEVNQIRLRLASGQLQTIMDGQAYNLSGSAEFVVRANDRTAPSVARSNGNPVNYHALESIIDDAPLSGQNYTNFLSMPDSLGTAYSLSNPASGIQPDAWHRMGSMDLAEGQHKFCLRRYHLSNAVSQQIGTNNDKCLTYVIDRTPPRITVFDFDGRELSSHSVTSATGIRVVGTDTFNGVFGAGISSISLTCEDFADSVGYPASPTGQLPQTESQVFPADLGILPQGACIAKVKDGAGNESTREFFIQRDHIALFDEKFKNQPLAFDLPLPADTPWSRANTLRFHLAHDEGIAGFTLLRGVGTVQEIVLNELPEDPDPATVFFVTLSSTSVGNKITESREVYTARLTPRVGDVVERFFVLDRNPPKVDLEEVTASPAGSMNFSGAAHDEASGVASVVAIPEADVGPDSGPPPYEGDTYPPGPASTPVSGTRGPGRYFHVARDRSGLAPAIGGSLLGFHVTSEAGYPPAGGGSEYCNRPQPAEHQPFFFGNAGYVLIQATMSAGFRFASPLRQQQYDAGRLILDVNPPNFGEVRLQVRSNDTTRVPFPALWTVRSFNAPTATATVMSIFNPGVRTQPLSVPLAPDVTAGVETSTSPAATAQLETCDEQGACSTTQVILGPGEIVPTNITTDCTFLTATVEGIDEDVSDTLPAAPTLNARFDFDGAFLEADEITTQGTLTAGRVPFAPPADYHLEGYVWSFHLSAGFRAPLRVGISHQGFWPYDILSKATCYRVSEGTLEELTCTVGADEAVAQSPGTSLFFTAVKDGLAPRSSPAYEGDSFELTDGSLVVSTRTLVTLEASDPAENGHVDSGVTATYMKHDGVFVSTSEAGVERYTGQPFTLSEGISTFSFVSEDFFHNLEPLQRATVAVDGTPPTSSLSLTGPMVVEPSRVIVGPQTLFSLSSADPISNGVSAGTAAVAMLIDETVESCGLALDETPVIVPGAPPGSCGNPIYSAPFSIGSGSHTLGYFGVDNVLNAGVLQSTVVIGDYLPPSITLTPPPNTPTTPSPSSAPPSLTLWPAST